MAWCGEQNVEYVLGVSESERLKASGDKELEELRRPNQRRGDPQRVFKSFEYRMLESWSRSRHVAGKAEHFEHGSNPRFAVTSLSDEEWDAQRLYEDLYCACGEMDDRIKQQQLDLFSGRTSHRVMQANQAPLYSSSSDRTRSDPRPDRVVETAAAADRTDPATGTATRTDLAARGAAPGPRRSTRSGARPGAQSGSC
jgi:hypothetical protein